MKFLFYFVPFLFFIIGYTLLAWLTHVTVVKVPALVGMPLVEALKTTSDLQLNARVVAVQEVADIPEGTVMSHVPMAGSNIKSHQRIFMVVSKHPELVKAPMWVGMDLDAVEKSAHQQGIRLKKYFVSSSSHLKNTVMAQFPSERQPLPDRTVILYCSSGEDMLVVVPDMRGLPVSVVQEFCARHELALEITYVTIYDAAYPYHECVVKHQRPLAGSIIELRKGIKFQIHVEKI